MNYVTIRVGVSVRPNFLNTQVKFLYEYGLKLPKFVVDIFFFLLSDSSVILVIINEISELQMAYISLVPYKNIYFQLNG